MSSFKGLGVKLSRGLWGFPRGERNPLASQRLGIAESHFDFIFELLLAGLYGVHLLANGFQLCPGLKDFIGGLDRLPVGVDGLSLDAVRYGSRLGLLAADYVVYPGPLVLLDHPREELGVERDVLVAELAPR